MKICKLLTAMVLPVVMFLWALPMAAQINRGVLEGIVTDPQGGVVPGVEVTVTSVDTNIATVMKTNETGYYRVGNLLPGKYRALFAQSGFSPLEMADIEITAGVESRLDAQLKVGTARQTIEVAAQAAQVETAPTNYTTTLGSSLVNDIPLQGRDIQQLVFLIPGVNAVAGPPGTTFGFNSQYGSFPDPTHMQGSALEVNGGAGGTNMWYLDGSFNITGMADNEAVNPSPDAVEEFQTITNAFAAEYGHTGGGVFNVVLKSGTNSLHGDLYDYLRNSALNARNPFTSISSTGQIIPSRVLHFDDAGGTLGGPIYIPHIYNGKNRTFFFFSYDESLLHLQGTQVFNVPTALMRQGDFSEVPNLAQYGIFNPYSTIGPDNNGVFARSAFGTDITPGGCTGSIVGGVAVNPTSATCNFATQIPATIPTPNGSVPGLNQYALYYLNSMPLPNYINPLSGCPLGESGAICSNYLGTVGNSTRNGNLSLKIDHQWSEKSKFFGEWLYNPYQYRFYRVPWTGPSFPGSSVGYGPQYPMDAKNQVIALGNTYTLSPTLINEFRASFTRQFTATNKGAMNSLMDISATQQELAPLNIPTSPSYPVPIDSISLPVGGGFTMGPAPWSNTEQGGEAYTFTDSLTKVSGKHTLKAGLVYRLEHAAEVCYFPTQLSFSGTTDRDPVTGLGGGGGLAEFLMGAVPSGTSSSGDQGPWYFRWRYWAGFVQDDFRVTPNFTLSAGLRYDLYGYARIRPHSVLSNFCPQCPNSITGLPGAVVYSGEPGAPSVGDDYFPANKTDFAPRINFAWMPLHDNGRTVIRAGYDTFYSDVLNAVNFPGESVEGMPGWFYFSYWNSSYYSNQCAPFTGTACVAFPMQPGNAGALGNPPVTSGFPALQRNPMLGTSVYNNVKPSTDPLVQRWDLEIQRELPRNLLLSLEYVGNHGTHMVGQVIRNIDYVPLSEQIQEGSAINAVVPITNYFSGQTATALANIWGSTELPNSILQSPFPAFSGVTMAPAFDGNDAYNALNVRLQKHFSSGFSFIAAYTWSKMIEWPAIQQAGEFTSDPFHDNMPNYLGGRVGFVSGTGYGGNNYQNADCRKCDRALATDDIPQMFNFASTYELPFGKGKAFLNQGGLLNGIFGGWQLSGTFNAESGIPLAVSGPCDQITCRPDLIGNPKAVPGGRNENQWINPAAFAPPFGMNENFWANYDPSSPLAYQWGTEGAVLSSARAPGFWNLDASLSKRFPIGEKRYVQFRWEAFNALNHQNLGYPNTGFCLPPGPGGETDLVHQSGCQFGRITNVQTDPRSIEFALKFVF